jgi:hypothetical protein
MRSCFGIGFLLSIVGFVAIADAAPPKKTPPQSSSLDADKLTPGVFTGTLVSTPDTDRMFTINVSYQKVQLKPGQNLGRANQTLQREYNRIMQLQTQAMMPPSRHHNPMRAMQQLQGAVAQFQNNLARTQANMFQVVNATQKVDFQLDSNVKVRVKDLPEAFDEKGNIKKYTKEELAELKGKDKNLPGYESSIDSLKPGQILQVALVVHKKPKPSTTSSSAASKDLSTEKGKEKDKDEVKEAPKPVEEAAVEHRLQVVTIMILKDSGSAASTSPSKNKNKSKK